MLAWSEAICADDAPSVLIGRELRLVVGQAGLGLGQRRRQRGVVDGGQGLTGGDRLPGAHVDGVDPTGDAEVEVGLLAGSMVPDDDTVWVIVPVETVWTVVVVVISGEALELLVANQMPTPAPPRPRSRRPRRSAPSA